MPIGKHESDAQEESAKLAGVLGFMSLGFVIALMVFWTFGRSIICGS